MNDKPHNNFFITVFSNKDNMVDLITQFLPEVAEVIEVESLAIDNTNYVNTALKELFSDIVYQCKGKDGKPMKVTLLLEHKSYPVAYPRFQLADYMFSIYRNHVKNKEPLSLVIPVVFYQGKTPWKYKTLTGYYGDIDNRLKAYIPDFKYHIIDLTQYSDEDILSLKVSFLLNALLAFKHKSESEYFKQYIKTVFHHIEFYPNTDRTQTFFHSLTVYIVKSTNITGKEMGQLIETLPKEGQPTLKTTYENIIDMGIDIGIEKGLKKGLKEGLKQAELEKLEMIKDALTLGSENAIIAKILKVPEHLVQTIRATVKSEFNIPALKLTLAGAIITTFKYLETKDIADFCQLPIEEVRNLEEQLKD